MIKVSIIVPVYNSQEYLADCIESLVNQTLKEIEIILIDDASLDNSLDILNYYQSRYPEKIRVYTNSQNKGTGASRNIGMSIAKGKYIGFVDSDDYVSPTMFEELYNVACSNEFPEIISTDLAFVKDSGALTKFDLNYQGRISSFNCLENPKNILNESPTSCNKIYRRDALNGIKFLEGTMWEDVAFSYSQLLNANRIFHINKISYFYRKRPDSGVSSKGFTPNDELLNTFIIADNIEENTRKSGRYQILKDEIQFLQVTTCLQRVSEVLHWDISEEDKEKICYYLHTKILEKYTDWRNLDIAELSGRVGILELERLKKIAEKYESKVILKKEDISEIISNYKR